MDDEGGFDSHDQPLMLDRVLPENSAEYMLFVIDDDSSKDSSTKPLAKLEKIRKAAVQLQDKLTKDYIWQRDGFNLEVVSKGGLAYLHGVTDYGDCVEDEWLIVYMLRELTKSFPGVWARICDNDGEFLLVEAANAVPKWLNPEIDANRVWIHEGRLEVIRDEAEDNKEVQKEYKSKLSLRDAVEAIKSATRETTESLLAHIPALEKEAFYRLQKYPDHISASVHYARALVPRKVAYILHDRPRAIAPASEAFYTRDPKAVRRWGRDSKSFGKAPEVSGNSEQPSKEITKPSTSSPSPFIFPPRDLVCVSIKFTKVIFAQLRGQRFSPPVEWSTEFAAKVEEQVHRPDAAVDTKEVEHLQVMANLGMKVTCGFELMAASAETSNNRIVREVGLVLEDIEEDGEDNVLPTDADIKKWKDVGREDDEAWLDINFDDFERELKGGNTGNGTAQPQWEVEPGFDTGFGDAGVQTDLRKIVSRFQSFLDDEAGVEGVDEDEDMDEDDEEVDSDEEDSDDDVSLDEEKFIRMMREMMGMPAEAAKEEPKAAEPSSKAKDNSAPELTPAPTSTAPKTTPKSVAPTNPETLDEDDEDDDEQGILQLAQQFEAELKGHGALRLEPPGKRKDSGAITGGKDTSLEHKEDEDDSPSESSEVDIDYNLAKNLLESFKNQEGMAGPAGNILSMLGLSLPRDDGMAGDDEGEDQGKGKGKGKA